MRKFRLPCHPASMHRWITVGIGRRQIDQQCRECGAFQTLTPHNTASQDNHEPHTASDAQEG